MTAHHNRHHLHWVRRLLLLFALTACSDDAVVPTGMDGPWQLTWTCEAGCEHAQPTIATAPMLDVIDDTAVWTATHIVTHVGERTDDCLRVPFSDSETIGRGREPFDLCAVDDVVSATIREHSFTGEVQVRWAMTGIR